MANVDQARRLPAIIPAKEDNGRLQRILGAMRVKCPEECGKELLFSNLEAHHRNICIRRIVQCPNIGCRVTCEFQRLQAHFDTCFHYREVCPRCKVAYLVTLSHDCSDALKSNLLRAISLLKPEQLPIDETMLLHQNETRLFRVGVTDRIWGLYNWKLCNLKLLTMLTKWVHQWIRDMRVT